MDTGILHLHNLLRWLVLIFGIIAIIRTASGGPFNNSAKKAGMFYTIFFDTQLLLGLVLFFMKGYMNKLSAGNVMSDAFARFFSVEHPLMMIIALILAHVGYTKLKKAIASQSTTIAPFVLFLISMIITLVAIPWPFRELIGRGWFPGMGV